MNMFDYFTDGWFSTSWGDTNSYELDEEYVIEVRATGLKKEDVTVEFNEDGSLHIKGKTAEAPKRKWLRREFNSASFDRNIILPEDIDEEKVSAKVENGILEIRIGKQEQPKTKKRLIEIA